MDNKLPILQLPDLIGINPDQYPHHKRFLVYDQYFAVQHVADSGTCLPTAVAHTQEVIQQEFELGTRVSPAEQATLYAGLQTVLEICADEQ